jgi:predicted lysophospholipase L1 biosynthesis ABC-type transport system permease subunit
LPAIGQVHSSHPSPGEGAVVLNSALAAPSSSDPTGEDGDARFTQPPVVAIRYRQGADHAAVDDRLRSTTSAIGLYPGSSAYLTLARPAEIVNARSIDRLPTLTSLALTFGALTSLSLALVAGVRRRRSDLAVLRTIGFTRGQVIATVFTQSLVLATLGIAAGAPVGVVVGRLAWRRFALRMAVDPSSPVPGALLMAALFGLAVAALVVAVAPGAIAARIRSRDVLRRD